MIISGEMQFYISAGTLIVIVIGAFKLGSIFKSLKNDIVRNTDLIKYNKDDISDNTVILKEHTNKIQDIEISDAENKVRILNIDTRVVEILSILKNK